jgi:P pilus assembly chaperone PapD
MMRFLLINPTTDKDQVYRVVVKPVIQGVEEDKQQKMALKVLVGYEALVIVRPKDSKIDLQATRKDNTLTLTNNGSTNANLQSGQQCDATGGDCKELNVTRIYAGQSWTTTLPHVEGQAKFQVWDGKEMKEMSF